MKTKYVVIKNTICPALIIFPEYVLHSIFNSLGMGKIISAGYVNLKTKCCYGESFSLKLKSNPKEDNILLGILLDG